MQGSSEDRLDFLVAYLSQHVLDSFPLWLSGAVVLPSLGRELDLPRKKTIIVCKSGTEHIITVGCRCNLWWISSLQKSILLLHGKMPNNSVRMERKGGEIHISSEIRLKGKKKCGLWWTSVICLVFPNVTVNSHTYEHYGLSGTSVLTFGLLKAWAVSRGYNFRSICNIFPASIAEQPWILHLYWSRETFAHFLWLFLCIYAC